MWIVRLALKHTYTFVVVALLIAVLGGVSIYRMSTDIFPEIDIPVVSVVWQYFGMPADEIETRIILINERVLTASVNDIEHIESQSIDGVGVIRIYFQPGAKIAEAEASQARQLNVTGAKVRIGQDQEAVVVLWRDVLEAFTGLRERNLVSGTEAALVDDFLTYVRGMASQLRANGASADDAGASIEAAARARWPSWGASLHGSIGFAGRAFYAASTTGVVTGGSKHKMA